MLLANPPRFHGCSTGWLRPLRRAPGRRAGGARRRASQGQVHRAQPHRPDAALQLGRRPAPPPSTLTSTAVTGAQPDQARPSSSPARGDHPRAGHEVREPRAARAARAARSGSAARPPRPAAAAAGTRCIWNPSNGSATTVIPVSHLTWAMPYQPGTTSRSGEPCCGGSGCAVHLVGEQDVVPQALRHRQAALVVLLDAAFDAVVGAGEDHLDRAVAHPGLPSTAASGVPVHSAVPTASTSQGWLTGRGSSRGPPVAGALQRHPAGAPRPAPHRVQVQRQGRVDAAVDGQPQAAGSIAGMS